MNLCEAPRHSPEERTDLTPVHPDDSHDWLLDDVRGRDLRRVGAEKELDISPPRWLQPGRGSAGTTAIEGRVVAH
jgi:hypothetical protein